jgi:hypothetical protein
MTKPGHAATAAPWLRRLDRAIDVGLEFHEILAEHFDKLFRGRLNPCLSDHV